MPDVLPVRVIICFARRARVGHASVLRWAQTCMYLWVTWRSFEADLRVTRALGETAHANYQSVSFAVSVYFRSAAFSESLEQLCSSPSGKYGGIPFLSLTETARTWILARHVEPSGRGLTCLPLLVSGHNRDRWMCSQQLLLSASRFRSRARFLAYEMGSAISLTSFVGLLTFACS